MTLGEWIKYVNMLDYCVIWSEQDKEEPVFSGFIMDIPWIYINKRIGRVNDDFDEPIFICRDLGEEYHHNAGLVINIIEDDSKAD